MTKKLTQSLLQMPDLCMWAKNQLCLCLVSKATNMCSSHEYNACKELTVGAKRCRVNYGN